MKLNRTNAHATARLSAIAVACLGLALGACTTLGTGTGSTLPGNQPVSFNWISKDGSVTGTMTATVGGAAYTGPYLELTQEAQTTQLSPMWTGWSPGWRDWGYGRFGGYGGFPLDVNTTNYSGKVVANLQGSGAARMRCRFNLNDPSSGMSGGGQGKCQIAGGETIDAVFPRA